MLPSGGVGKLPLVGLHVPNCELFGGRFHYRPRQSRPSCQPRGLRAIPRPATRRPHLLNGAAPARSRIATGSALRATVVFRRFARLGLAACANEWHLNAAPHILRELYRQLQARSSPPGVHDTRATACATGHGSKDTATAQRPSSPTSGALPARGQHAQSPWSGPRAEDSLRVAKTSNRPHANIGARSGTTTRTYTDASWDRNWSRPFEHRTGLAADYLGRRWT